MSKRLFDTELWKKQWFFDLPDKLKLFWFYILSDCDAAGVWTVNWKIAQAYLGSIDQDKVVELLNGQVQPIGIGNYWIIIDYIRFQYGYPVKETSPMYKKLNDLLNQRGLSINTLYDTVSHTVCSTVYDTVKDKDKDKDIDKDNIESPLSENDEEKEWRIIINKHYPQLLRMKDPLTFEQHNKMVARYGKLQVRLVYERMQNWPELCKKRVSANLTASKFLRQGV